MSVGLTFFSLYCCPDDKNEDQNGCTRSKPGQFVQRYRPLLLLTELAVGIAAVVLGLLSALSVVAIPAAAGYAMIGVGAFILAIDLLMMVVVARLERD